MNVNNFKLAEGILPATYVSQARESIKTRENMIKNVLSQRRLPEEGWDDLTIKLLLQDLSLMDSNNFSQYAGAGEREGRIENALVRDLHNGMGHGIGRSGDISANQPKAAGSSLMAKLTQYFVLEILQRSGATRTKDCYVFPLATGMAIVMCLLALRAKNPAATHVVWPRIDQKTCLKAILAAGLIPVVVELGQESHPDGSFADELRANVQDVESAIESTGGPEKVLCVLTTTSCFAPRAYDRVADIAVLCARVGVPHLINNAYGITSSVIMHNINEAIRLGRVDAYVQSTDKNFLVPVGGSVIAGPNSHLEVRDVCKTYPGRASGTPTMDVFITLLSMGTKGYKAKLIERKEMYVLLKAKMGDIAEKHGERLLSTPNNPISLAMTITPRGKKTNMGVRASYGNEPKLGEEDNREILVNKNNKHTSTHPDSDPTEITRLGAMLFRRGVSGARVVSTNDKKDVSGVPFVGYGAHTDNYHTAYLTVAAAVGMTEMDVTMVVERVDKALTEYYA